LAVGIDLEAQSSLTIAIDSEAALTLNTGENNARVNKIPNKIL